MSTKYFCHNLQHGGMVNAVWVGLLHDAEGTCASAAGADSDIKGVMCMQHKALATLLQELDDIFQAPTKPRAHIKHQIDLIDPDQSIPYFYMYHTSATELNELIHQIDKMLAKGWTSPLTSTYSHPMLFSCRKVGPLRLCVDFRLLNANKCLNCYPLPCIDELLDCLANQPTTSTHCILCSLATNQCYKCLPPGIATYAHMWLLWAQND